MCFIGRQVNTNLGTTIDLLALDGTGDVVVVELKRDRTPRDTLAQALEYASFQSKEGTRLLSQEIVVGTEPSKPQRVSSGSLPVVSREDFMRALDQNGRAIFERILAFAQAKGMPVHWGTRGFSLNVDVNETHVAVFFCYPPASVYKQSIYTTLMGRGGISTKTAVPEEEVSRLWSEAESTGLFRRAGHELRCTVERAFTESEVGRILSWCEQVIASITKYGLKE